MRFVRFHTGVLLLFCWITTVGQQNDAGLWTTFSIEKDLPRRFSLSFDEELRFKNNLSQFDLNYSNIQLIFKPMKKVKVGIGYRFEEKYDKNLQISYRHRMVFDASYKQKVRNFSVIYKNRIFCGYQNIYSNDYGKIPEWVWRNKLEIKRTFYSFTPYLGTEQDIQLIDPKRKIDNFSWNQSRVYLGVDYKISKYKSFGVYYLIQNEINVKNPETLYVFGLQYLLSIP